MRTRTTTITALSAVMLLALTGCLGEAAVDTSPKAAASKAAKGDAPAKSKTTKKEKVAKVGDTLSVTGFQDGEQLDVTLKKWADPVQAAHEFDAPAQGKRWAAGQFEIVNTGSRVYDDSPTNGVQVADSEGQRFDTWFAEISAGPQMASAVKLPKGEKALGWIVFEVPKNSKLTSVQFTMNSGMANEAGQWKLG